MNPPHLTLITGTSRGLGAALAAQCLRQGHTVIGIARHRLEVLDEVAERHGATLHQWCHDLSAPEQAAWPVLEWLQAQEPARYASATLINNAGMLGTLQALALADPLEVARTLRLGLEAPMVLTSVFLRGTRGWAGPRKVLNISSGLGQRAMAGSAGYCAAKAGLDHFSRCVALEEAAAGASGAAIVAIAPGVVDTLMQAELRGADPEVFADQPSFAQLHEQGRLQSAEDTAQRLLTWLAHPAFGQEPVVDVRKLPA